MTYSRIIGTGSHLPENCLTHAEMEKMVDTTDEWIRTRTGIEQRHIAAEGETTSDLAVEACLRRRLGAVDRDSRDAREVAGCDTEVQLQFTTAVRGRVEARKVRC